MTSRYEEGAGASRHSRTVEPAPSSINLTTPITHHQQQEQQRQRQRQQERRPDTLALLREGGHKWERRAPLAPRHVEALCAQGYRVLVQPSVSDGSGWLVD